MAREGRMYIKFVTGCLFYMLLFTVYFLYMILGDDDSVVTIDESEFAVSINDHQRDFSTTIQKLHQREKQNSVDNLIHSRWNVLDLGSVQVAGRWRQKRGFLTIGIPSIKRARGAEYLLQTIQYIVSRTTQKEKESIVLLVFLANFDTDYNAAVLKNISARYGDYMNSGFILVMQVPEKYYPPLTNLKRNYNDPPNQVAWRSKQNVDYAFMFFYGRNISEYYIQIEDDVMPAFGFVKDIRAFILKNYKNPWVCLEFSLLGFIGKLFKSGVLDKLARYLILFYDEQPCDWLINYFLSSVTQTRHIYNRKSLFQHKGIWSSSSEKSKQGPFKAYDIYFREGKLNN